MLPVFCAQLCFGTVLAVGSPEQVLERAQQYAEAGVDNLALQVVPGMARELIEEFSRQVIARL